MSSDRPGPNQLPRRIAKLVANHGLQERASWPHLILTGASQVLLATGGIVDVIGAWQAWQWKKTRPSA